MTLILGREKEIFHIPKLILVQPHNSRHKTIHKITGLHIIYRVTERMGYTKREYIQGCQPHRKHILKDKNLFKSMFILLRHCNPVIKQHRVAIRLRVAKFWWLMSEFRCWSKIGTVRDSFNNEPILGCKSRPYILPVLQDWVETSDQGVLERTKVMNRKRGTSTSSTYVTMMYNKHVRFPELLPKEESEMPNERTHNRPNEKIRTYPNERKY